MSHVRNQFSNVSTCVLIFSLASGAWITSSELEAETDGDGNLNNIVQVPAAAEFRDTSPTSTTVSLQPQDGSAEIQAGDGTSCLSSLPQAERGRGLSRLTLRPSQGEQGLFSPANCLKGILFALAVAGAAIQTKSMF